MNRPRQPSPCSEGCLDAGHQVGGPTDHHARDAFRIGHNINGPSLIRTPDWIPDALGRYYLYFAHHTGDHIRLTYADALEGPWRIYPPGVLALADSRFTTVPLQLDNITNPLWLDFMQRQGPEILKRLQPHIASPDVHVMAEPRPMRMYYHGLLQNGSQMTRVAHSIDGLHCTPGDDLLGPSYFRVFMHAGWHYAMPLVFPRGFERGARHGNQPRQRRWLRPAHDGYRALTDTPYSTPHRR